MVTHSKGDVDALCGDAVLGHFEDSLFEVVRKTVATRRIVLVLMLAALYVDRVVSMRET